MFTFPRRRVVILGASSVVASGFLYGASGNDAKVANHEPNASLAHGLVEYTYDICAIEGFSPIQTARIFAYTCLALSEMHGRPPLLTSGVTDRAVDAPRIDRTASPQEIIRAWRLLIPMLSPGVSPATWDMLRAQENLLKNHLGDGKEESHEYVLDYALRFAEWAQNDSYILLRETIPNLPKGDEYWVPTLPGRLRPVDHFADRVLPIFMTDPFEVILKSPTPHSTHNASAYFEEARIVQANGSNASRARKRAATWWADGPYESATPVGHWMLLASSALRAQNASGGRCLDVFTLLSTILLDATISCFAWKYHYATVRPITYINRHLDPKWRPSLPTPPFPEYPSGHSVISGTAATLLQQLVPIHKPTADVMRNPMREPETQWVGSWANTARRASQSRVWAGLHYPVATEQGLILGERIAAHCLRRIRDAA